MNLPARDAARVSGNQVAPAPSAAATDEASDTRVRLPTKSPQLASVHETNQELQPDER
jgi:hypothetical protein